VPKKPEERARAVYAIVGKTLVKVKQKPTGTDLRGDQS